MIRVTHVITGLPRGGAQSVLSQLLQYCDRDRFAMDVISLGEIGPVGQALAGKGVRVRALNLSRSIPSPVGMLRLVDWLRRDAPDIVQTWLYHGDLIGGVAGRLAGRTVVWNLRQTDLRPATTRRSTMWTAKISARMSARVPRRIICCSEATRVEHTRLGYDADRMLVIGNGVDVTRFKPDRAARAAVRAELSLPPDAPLVGLVARFHPQKDHRTFVTAASEIARQHPRVVFVLCGEDVDESNAELRGWIADSGAAGQFRLLGIRDDVPRLTAALDVAVSSSSYGEGFSNSLLEAIACGVIPVGTDSGDAARIIGDAGWVVRRQQPAELATAVVRALDLPLPERERRSTVALQLARTHSLQAMVDAYQRLYEGLCQPRP